MAEKQWALTPHAVERMMERHVSPDLVRQIIDAPDWKIAQGPKWIYAKSVQGRSDNMIAAVLMERKERDLWLVLTVMVNFNVREK